jgi:hypothetical protein
MSTGSTSRRRRLRRRLFVATLIGAGAVALATQQASAATSAAFAHGVLTVLGDGGSNDLTISRDAAGTIVINGGAIVDGTTIVDVGGEERALPDAESSPLIEDVIQDVIGDAASSGRPLTMPAPEPHAGPDAGARWRRKPSSRHERGRTPMCSSRSDRRQKLG